MATIIERPEIEFDPARHVYRMGGEVVPGISSVAKVGSDSFGPASWWGYKLGVEAALHAESALDLDAAYAAAKATGITPNRRRDNAANRGTNVHDALEFLAQDDRMPSLDEFPEEERGHVQALLRWYLDWRPIFTATEIVVGCPRHRFAGRYDVRARLSGAKLHEQFPEVEWPDGMVDVLLDLKTSKGVYPESHFVQLAGYELASVSMGFPATAAQFVLHTRPDGSYRLVRSTAGPDDFLAYLAAYRAVERVKSSAKKRRR